MPERAKVGSFSTGTGAVNTTIALTGFGFQPQAVLFWWSGEPPTASDHVTTGPIIRGYGIATGPTSRAVCAAYTPTSGGSAHSDREDSVVQRLASTTVSSGRLDLQSFDADGMTLKVVEVFGAALQVNYLALGGLGQASLGRFQAPTATGNLDITTAGFQPDCVLLISSLVYSAAPPTIDSAYGHLSLGIATASQQAIAFSGDLPGVNGQSVSYCRRGEVIAALGFTPTGTATTVRASVSQFLSNGFRLNFLQADSARYCWYLAIKGGKHAIAGFSTRTDTTAFPITGVGFQPIAALFASDWLAESAAGTGDTTGSRWSLGVGTGPANRVAMAAAGTNKVADGTSVAVDRVYSRLSSAPALVGAMDLVSMDPDGFTVTMNPADPDSQFVWAWAFGTSSASLAGSGLSVSSPAIGASALRAFIGLSASLPSWPPVLGSPTLQQKVQLTSAPLTISRIDFGVPGSTRLTAVNLVVQPAAYAFTPGGSITDGPPELHSTWGPWTPLPTQSQQISEAIDILGAILDALLKTVPGRTVGRPAWDFRRSVGYLRANGGALIFGGGLGDAAVNAWTLATGCGATFDSFDTLRLAILALTPQYLPAIAVADLAVELTLMQMAQATAATTYVSRDDALAALNRISAAFAPVEEAVADEHDAATYQLLVATRAAAVRDLAERGRQLPRVVPYAFATAFPTLWIANRLYGDGSRSDELRAENKIVHPAFAPISGICLSQ
jgi:hypothetical protein